MFTFKHLVLHRADTSYWFYEIFLLLFCPFLCDSCKPCYTVICGTQHYFFNFFSKIGPFYFALVYFYPKNISLVKSKDV